MNKISSKFSLGKTSCNLDKTILESKVDQQFSDLKIRGIQQHAQEKQTKNISKTIYKKIIKKFFDTPSKSVQKQRFSVKQEPSLMESIDCEIRIRKNLKKVGLDIKSFTSDSLRLTQKFIYNPFSQKTRTMIVDTVQLSDHQKLGSQPIVSLKTSKPRLSCCIPNFSSSKNSSIQKHRKLSPVKASQKKIGKSIYTEPSQELNKQEKDLEKVNYESHILFYLKKGNNHKIIRTTMKKRFWWKQTKNITVANFVWSQNKIYQIFHKQIPQKSEEKSLASNSNSKYKRKNKFLKNTENLVKILNHHQIQQYLNLIDKQSQIHKPMSFEWKCKQLSLKRINSPTLIHNHLPGNHMIGNKKQLLFCLRSYQQLKGQHISIPLTFHIKQFKDKEHLIFENKFNENINKQQHNIWILKPGQQTNRGNGIFCFSDLEPINNIIKQKDENRTYIIQQYISKPLLYNKRKFDIRTYLLITIVNSKIKAYWYKQGYIRTSGKIFSLDNLTDISIHLTNDAVQKYDNSYGKYEDGNKLTYSQMEKYLNSNNKVGGWNKIYQSMKQIATRTVQASQIFLDQQKRQNFELFGLDFLVDQSLNTYLLQVNYNPCLETGCPVLQKIIPYLIENTFQLTIDTQFPPPSNYSSTQKHNLAKNPLLYNHFQLIFDEQVENSVHRQLLKENINFIQKKDQKQQ